MKEDVKYCSSSFLTYRTIIDRNKCFSKKIPPKFFNNPIERKPINNSKELHDALKSEIEKATVNGKAALALSGGIDSAILAKYMPKSSTAYTFQCIVPGKKVTNEVPRAAEYAKECGLKHKTIKVYWEDFEKYAPILMKNKGAPIHSIEVQIYKAALQAKKDGFETLIFGESADCLYGGQSILFGKEWTLGEFIDRYTFVKPYSALKEYELEFRPYIDATTDGYVNVQKFMEHTFFNESVNSYYNACETATIKCSIPFSSTYFNGELDKKLLHSGKNKYLVYDLFKKLYPGFNPPQKTPMPRPMNEWFKDWQGPTRPEFWPHCTDHMTGDQKYYIWVLEAFLNLISEGE